MLNKLRLKFIAVSLAATLVVLTLIVGGINVKNYSAVKKNAERTLQMLAQNGGEFPSKDEKPAPGAEEPPKKNDGGMSPEMPFETRYFTVTLGANGDVSAVNTKNIAAISEDEAKALATKIKERGKTSGRSGNYRFASYAVADDRVMYIFLDCTRDFANYSEFLSASCMVSAGGFLLVAALIVVLSGVVVKPTVETYKKQKQFITDAGHELKTPLTVINADCEILEYESGGNEWTESIKNQVKKLSGLVEKLVFLSRMDEENQKMVMSEFSLSEVVEDAAKPYSAVCLAAGKKFSSSVEKNLSAVGDVKQIAELTELLLDNAVKYSDSEGNVNIALSSSGGQKKLTVSNTTDGVPKGNLDVLFDRFYRLDSSRNSGTGGHGIGLSVAKAIVKLHKGKISAFSPDGKTIIFTVILK